MNYNNKKNNNSTVFMHMMCAIVFTLFTWCYLYFFQADVIAVAQHVLSNGVTTYNKTVGAVLITLLLLALQLIVYGISRLRNGFHALTYLPSAIILAVLTDIGCDIDNLRMFGIWCIVLPVALVVSAGVIFVARQLQCKVGISADNVTAHTVWASMLVFFLMFTGICVVANTNAVFHYRANAESCLLEYDLEGALCVGAKSQETDSSLTMTRAYALARSGELGEKLFSYPVVGSGNSLVPMPIDSADIAEGKVSQVRFLMYPLRRMYAALGACPSHKMQALDYLRLLEKRGKASHIVKDYVLAIHLVDRDIDGFAKDFVKYYGSSDSIAHKLPRHYQEALTLYRHQRTNPIVQYYNEVMDTDYEDFQTLLHKYSLESERKLNAFENYKDSYWYYFEFK